MTRASRRLGAVLAVLYLATAVTTSWWGPGHLRPLFDGFASHPGEYSWVRPPKEFATGNRPPGPAQVRVNVSAGGSTPVIAETVDGQALASLPAGALPAHGGDTAATLELRPLDSGRLGALPAGLRAEGNAYQVSATYIPSSAKVTALAAPGTVGVTSKATSDTLLFSADGRSWRPVEGQALSGAKGFTGPLPELGYVLAASHGSPRAMPSSGGAPLALYLAAGAVPLVLGYLVLGRRRRPPERPAAPARAATGGGRRPPPPGTGRRPRRR